MKLNMAAHLILFDIVRVVDLYLMISVFSFEVVQVNPNEIVRSF